MNDLVPSHLNSFLDVRCAGLATVKLYNGHVFFIRNRHADDAMQLFNFCFDMVFASRAGHALDGKFHFLNMLLIRYNGVIFRFWKKYSGVEWKCRGDDGKYGYKK